MDSAEAPRFLLLLPPPPQPLTSTALRSAYGDSVKQVLREVASHAADSSKAAVLEIALACEHLVGAHVRSRSSLYHETQRRVAGVYKLVCVIAAEEAINIEDADGVDVRVLLIAWSPQKASESSYGSFGLVVDLHTLANCERPWQYAFGVETDAGGAMMSALVGAKGHTRDLGGVEGSSTSGESRPNEPASSKHRHVAVGGTFDHLHMGHKLLITMTIFAVDDGPTDEERSAALCITVDQLLAKKKYAQHLESWSTRQAAVAAFFDAITDYRPSAEQGQRRVTFRNDPSPNGRSIDHQYPNGLVVKYTELQDPFGPPIYEQAISALVLSAETRAGGKAINDKRVEQGWEPIEIFEVDVLDAESELQEGNIKEGFDSKLSSTAIREKLARKAGGKT